MIWIKATSAETYKRLNIEYDKTMLANSTEDIWNNKEASNTTEEVEQYFPGLLSFTDSTEQQIQSRPVDKDRRKMYYS